MNLLYKLINRWNQYTVKPQKLIPCLFGICDLSDTDLTEFDFALSVEGKKSLWSNLTRLLTFLIGYIIIKAF